MVILKLGKNVFLELVATNKKCTNECGDYHYTSILRIPSLFLPLLYFYVKSGCHNNDTNTCIEVMHKWEIAVELFSWKSMEQFEYILIKNTY